VGKVDRRVQRTQDLLGTALVDLIFEKGYEAVTIKDVTERADVAYVTFFRHYRDLDELLTQRLKSGLEELVAAMEAAAGNVPWDQRSPEHDRSDGLMIFHHAEQNAAFYRLLLNSAGALRVRKEVIKTIAGILMAKCEPLLGEQGGIPAEVAANHIAASLLALIEWWLEHDMPYPAERMAEIYERLIVMPALQPQAVQ
jgi:AcrR family transcriptional regulator